MKRYYVYVYQDNSVKAVAVEADAFTIGEHQYYFARNREFVASFPFRSVQRVVV